MALSIGTQLGSHEITALLGKGGMGEVYRARDLKLKREVAIKILPEEFSLDADRVSRFQREAEVLASLNHPNIAAIHDLEETDGTRYLVLELVEGETLADRIARGPIPIEEALHIAIQTCEALEAAHERGIIHRDLKPANVKLTPDGKVKVLDFGLAKALGENIEVPANISQSPTLSAAATGVGIILGTAGYMAPEQARGKQADRRSDIWAFGATLFEILTAHRAFEGETVNDTIAKVLERDPDWNRLPQQTPQAIRKLLQHCLTKNAKDRLQAIGDARTLLQEFVADPEALASEVSTAPHPRWKKLLPWAMAPLCLVAGWFMKPSGSRQDNVVSRFEYSLPNSQNLMHNYHHGLDFSPDGKRIAFVAGTLGNGSGFFPVTAGPRSIYVRRLEQWDASQIPGTDGAVSPFFSPDGQWLGFFLQGKLVKVPLDGGPPVVLAEKINTPMGSTWGENGLIVFAGDVRGGLKSVSDAGGEPQEFTQLDKDANEISHRLPHFLPDGSAVLFTALPYSYAAPDWKRAQIWIKSLKNGERKRLLENAVDARYVDGRLVFAREGKLFAVAFDPKTLAITGSPVPVLDGVTHAVAGVGVAATTGAAQFSISENGSLLYAPGSIEPALENSVVWVDRHGNVTPVGTRPMSHGSVRVSPDGKMAAVTEYYVDRLIWVFDLVRGTQERQTFDNHSADGVWSPDGQRLAFRSNSSGPTRLYLKSLGSPDPVPLTPGPLDYAGSFTADGKELVFSHGEAGNNSATYDIDVISIDEPNKIRPVVNTRFNETYPSLSPDGHWLAYCSDESGRSQLYVQSYPTAGKRVPVSTDGATEPVWSRDGKELFYRNGSSMMSVPFKVSGADFVPETPAMLFQGAFLGTTPARMYDIAPDGRFLMVQPIPSKTGARDTKIFPSTLRIIINWTAELDAIVRAHN
jgi:serine/threonine-protein kinase